MVRESDDAVVVGVGEGSSLPIADFTGEGVGTVIDEWDTRGETMGPTHVPSSITPGVERLHVIVAAEPLSISGGPDNG